MENNTFSIIQELLQQKADYQARLNLLPYDGTPEIKEKNDGRYLYIRKRVASRLTSEMLVRQGNCANRFAALKKGSQSLAIQKQICLRGSC